jgi:hypothetical protein
VLLVVSLPFAVLDDLDLGSWLNHRVLSLKAAPRGSIRWSADGDRNPLFHETQAALRRSRGTPAQATTAARPITATLAAAWP